MSCIGVCLNCCCWEKGSEKIDTATSNQSFHELKVNDLWGKPFDLTYLKEKRLVMVVNVACK